MENLQRPLLPRARQWELGELQVMGMARENTFKRHLGARSAVLGHYGVREMEMSRVSSRFLVWVLQWMKVLSGIEDSGIEPPFSILKSKDKRLLLFFLT